MLSNVQKTRSHLYHILSVNLLSSSSVLLLLVLNIEYTRRRHQKNIHSGLQKYFSYAAKAFQVLIRKKLSEKMDI